MISQEYKEVTFPSLPGVFLIYFFLFAVILKTSTMAAQLVCWFWHFYFICGWWCWHQQRHHWSPVSTKYAITCHQCQRHQQHWEKRKSNFPQTVSKKIQRGPVAKSFMRKGLLIYGEMRKYFPIYEEAVSHIWLCNCSTLNFLIYCMRKIWFSFLSV